MDIHCFIQARMSSQRFPGKMLANFLGKPMVKNVVEAVTAVLPLESITVLTSQDPTDDVLVDYLFSENIPCYRGPLDNVLNRFQMATLNTPASWVMRICGDSPLLSPKVLKLILSAVNEEYDIVTNVHPRTFPKGQSVECIRRTTLLDLKQSLLTETELEHVTPYFYQHPSQYRILNIQNPWQWATDNFCVDYPEDIERLALCMQEEV